MTGPQLVKAGREILEAAGWDVYSANHNKALPQGMRHLPMDLFGWRENVSVYLECKGDNDEVTD